MNTKTMKLNTYRHKKLKFIAEFEVDVTVNFNDYEFLGTREIAINVEESPPIKVWFLKLSNHVQTVISADVNVYEPSELRKHEKQVRVVECAENEIPISRHRLGSAWNKHIHLGFRSGAFDAVAKELGFN